MDQINNSLNNENYLSDILKCYIKDDLKVLPSDQTRTVYISGLIVSILNIITLPQIVYQSTEQDKAKILKEIIDLSRTFLKVQRKSIYASDKDAKIAIGDLMTTFCHLCDNFIF